MIISLDSILNARLVTNWRQCRNYLWEKGEEEKSRGFFKKKIQEKKNIRPAGLEPRSEALDE